MVKQITAEEFDRMFDDGEDISEYIDWSSAKRINETEHLDVEVSVSTLQLIDSQASRQGLTRQALIRSWIEERAGGDR